MRAPDLEHVGKVRRLVSNACGERAARVAKRTMLQRQRQPRRRREHVVGRLAHVDVIVRMHDVIGAARAAEQLRGAIGEHLVGVHVVRRAGAGLIDVDDELIAQLTGEDFVGGGDDRVGASAIETIERAIRFRGGALDQDRRVDEARGRNQPADREIGSARAPSARRSRRRREPRNSPSGSRSIAEGHANYSVREQLSSSGPQCHSEVPRSNLGTLEPGTDVLRATHLAARLPDRRAWPAAPGATSREARPCRARRCWRA